MASSLKQAPFVDRQTELNKFAEVLDSAEGPWLIWVVGPAGQGKSRLLEAFLAQCEARKLKHSGLIDLFHDGLRTPLGIIEELARCFHVENDPELHRAIQRWKAELSRPEPDEDAVKHARSETESALTNALQPKRRSKPRVIVADTVELVADGLGRWFFGELLPMVV